MRSHSNLTPVKQQGPYREHPVETTNMTSRTNISLTLGMAIALLFPAPSALALTIVSLAGCATGRSRFVKPFGLLVLSLLAICATLCCGQFSTAGTITAHVTASNHDAEEHLNRKSFSDQSEAQGEMETLTSGDLEIGSEQGEGRDWQAVGVQFFNLGIAQGSTINSAILRLGIRNRNVDWGDKNFTIFADDVGSSANFTSGDFNLSNRTRSSAAVHWFLDRTGIAVGNIYDSPDLAALVQEVVNREDWSENNQLSLLVFPDVYLANTAGSNTRVSDIGFYSFDHETGAAPQLIVDFTVIPEPASVTILGLIGTVGLLRRRRVFLASGRLRWLKSALLIVAAGAALAPVAYALDGGTLRVNPRNGWSAFEVISVGDNPSGDGFSWSMPGTFDGLGAWMPDSSTMRLLVNHEIGDAAISEVNLSLTSFQTAVSNTISGGSTGGVTFVNSARQAYDRWSSDGGANWTNTTNTSNTSFSRFCSGQSYTPDTFGAGRGFVDDIYITGEELFELPGRLFALDLANRDFYQLSGATGSATGGIGGMPYDSWENAALLDTGETNHVALLLSPDGGSKDMQLYIGEKGKDTNGNASADFLARNGLAWGSYYYLNDTLPISGTSTNGSFDTTAAGALNSSKLEDVDTSPSDPTRVVLGDQTSGLFTFDFGLDFTSGSFSAAGSGFSITKVLNHVNDVDDTFGDADNVDWSDATTLGGTTYAEGLIFVNEDTGTGNGEIWMLEPDGSGLTKIGDTTGISGSTETSGILDISGIVGYNPGSVLLTNNQSSNASLSVLINPDATPVPEPSALTLLVLGGVLLRPRTSVRALVHAIR